MVDKQGKNDTTQITSPRTENVEVLGAQLSPAQTIQSDAVAAAEDGKVRQDFDWLVEMHEALALEAASLDDETDQRCVHLLMRSYVFQFAIAAYPCRSNAELHRKSSYLADRLCAFPDQDMRPMLAALLASQAEANEPPEPFPNNTAAGEKCAHDERQMMLLLKLSEKTGVKMETLVLQSALFQKPVFYRWLPIFFAMHSTQFLQGGDSHDC